MTHRALGGGGFRKGLPKVTQWGNEGLNREPQPGLCESISRTWSTGYEGDFLRACASVWIPDFLRDEEALLSGQAQTNQTPAQGPR